MKKLTDFRKARQPLRQRKTTTDARKKAACVGEVFSADVIDLAADGRGVVLHPSGVRLFVPGVWIGERGEFRVVALQKSSGEAQCETLLKPSPARIAAPCPYVVSCGGCPWQSIDYAAQLQAKQKRVAKQLQSLGATDCLKPIAPSPMIFGYRNRAQLKTDGAHLGYLAPRSHKLVDVDDCLVLTDTNRTTLKQLRQSLPNPAWRPTKKMRYTTVDIDHSVTANTAAVNKRLPFRQANSAQNTWMKSWLKSQLENREHKFAVELFCGDGNFTEVLLEMSLDRLTAIESEPEAIASLKQKNGSLVTALCENLFEDGTLARIKPTLQECTLMVLDPPRGGFKNLGQWLEALPNLQTVAYISCDLATLTRDLKDLLKRNFTIKTFQPVDQFPHTPHIESLVLLSR